jgi:hypothetical protein
MRMVRSRMVFPLREVFEYLGIQATSPERALLKINIMASRFLPFFQVSVMNLTVSTERNPEHEKTSAVFCGNRSA